MNGKRSGEKEFLSRGMYIQSTSDTARVRLNAYVGGKKL
jgi:hypothetical protein